MLEREPSLVCLTITAERTEVALIGVYLVILGLELDPDFEPERPLPPPLPPPRPPPPRPPPLPACDNSSSTTVMKRRRRSTVHSRVVVDDGKLSLIRSVFSFLVTYACHICTVECGKMWRISTHRGAWLHTWCARCWNGQVGFHAVKFNVLNCYIVLPFSTQPSLSFLDEQFSLLRLIK